VNEINTIPDLLENFENLFVSIRETRLENSLIKLFLCCKGLWPESEREQLDENHPESGQGAKLDYFKVTE